VIDGVGSRIPVNQPVADTIRQTQPKAGQKTERNDLDARLLDRLLGGTQESSAPISRPQKVPSAPDDLMPHLGRYVDVIA
jgi:hypothetical protein